MTLPAITASQRDVLRFNPTGRRGAVASSFDVEDLNVINSGADALAVSTLTVTGASAKTYATAVLGIPVSFVAGGADTTAMIATGLANAITSDPAIAGQVTATASAAVVTIRGNFPGMTLGVDGSDADLTAAVVTAGASSPAIGFGRVLLLAPSATGRGDAVGSLPGAAADLAPSPSVFVIEMSGGASTQAATLTLNVPGGAPLGATHTAAGTEAADASATAFAAALDAIDGLSASADDEFVTVTGPAGASIVALTGALLDGLVSANEGNERPRRAITVARHDVESGADQIPRYPANSVMRCARRAELYYDGFEPGDRDVYVGTAANEEGVCFRAAGAGRVLDPALTVLRVADDGVAVIRCEFPA